MNMLQCKWFFMWCQRNILLSDMNYCALLLFLGSCFGHYMEAKYLTRNALSCNIMYYMLDLNWIINTFWSLEKYGNKVAFNLALYLFSVSLKLVIVPSKTCYSITWVKCECMECDKSLYLIFFLNCYII